MNKLFQSTFAAIALGLLFSIPYAAPLEAAAKIDDSLNAMTFAHLPTCNASSSNSRATINDASAGSVGFNAVVSGGGTGTASVFCDGSSWKFVAGGGSGGGGGPLAAMAAPNGTSTTNGNTATMGNYANSCNGNSTSCLISEDRFTGAQLNSSFWFPWQGTGSSVRWGGCGDPSQCWVPPEPYSTESICGAPGNTSGYVVDSCIQNSLGVSDYFNPYPFGYNYNSSCQIVGMGDDGDGVHLSNNSNGLILTTTPTSSGANLPSKHDCQFGVTDAGFNPLNAGFLWASSAISSTRHTPFICPATGCYFQVRFIYPDLRSGMWPAIWMMPEGGTGGAEFDLTEGGFEYQNSFANTNRVVSTTWHKTGTTATGFNGGLCGSNGSDGFECQLDSGTDLTEIAGTSNWHVLGVEYVPGQKWTIFLDGKPYGQFTGTVGNASYDMIIMTDVCNAGCTSANFHTPTNGNNGPFHLYINDIQMYKLPGQ